MTTDKVTHFSEYKLQQTLLLTGIDPVPLGISRGGVVERVNRRTTLEEPKVFSEMEKMQTLGQTAQLIRSLIPHLNI